MSEKRRSFIESLNLHLAELFQAISGRTECLQLNFNRLFRSRKTEEGIFQVLESAAEKEMRAGHSLMGPHRDDFR